MRIGLTIATLLIATAVSGCAATQQSTQIEQSGFLGDYSMLAPGGEDEAAFRYVDLDAGWADYDKILLDPITVWRDTDQSEIPSQDMQKLADNLWGLMYLELEKDYTMVSVPQEKAIRIQVAITESERSSATLDVMSTVIPIGIVVSSATEFVTGEPSFGGAAAAEFKATDAATGATLAAAVDKRVGGKDLGGAFDSWDDVNSAFAYWSQLTRFRLCELRDGTACVAPG